MPDLWLGDVGIRVTDLARSLDFYTRVLGLEEIARGGDDAGRFGLVRDKHDRQRLELNWCADDNPFAAPFTPGEAVEHLEVRVKSVPETLAYLKGFGVLPATKKIWVNRAGIEKFRSDPRLLKFIDQDVWDFGNGRRIAYVQDPDGDFLCLYDHPDEAWGSPISDGY